MNQSSRGRWASFAPQFLALLLGVAVMGAAAAGQAPVFSTGDGAIGGYDPVAYFRLGQPVRGSETHSLQWAETTWRFASQENLEAFRSNPEKYAPRYGGYCAYAVSRGYTARTVPEAWQIVDDRLYLNFSLGVRDRWRKDIPGNIEKANANWPRVIE